MLPNLVIADKHLEERQLDIPFLPPKETDTSILLFHFVLYNPPYNHVRSRGYTPYVGCLLRPRHNVISQHTPVP